MDKKIKRVYIGVTGIVGLGAQILETSILRYKMQAAWQFFGCRNSSPQL